MDMHLDMDIDVDRDMHMDMDMDIDMDMDMLLRTVVQGRPSRDFPKPPRDLKICVSS